MINLNSKNKFNNDEQIIYGEDIEEKVIGEGEEAIKVKKQVKKEIKDEETNILSMGSRELKDIIAPDIDRTNPGSLMVGDKFVRSFVMSGYPSVVSVGWLNDLFNSDADIDTAIHIAPVNESDALDQLTKKITQYEAQLMIEVEKGNVRDQTRLQANIEQLYQQRISLEQNYENLFNIQIAASLYTDSQQELDKETQRLDNRLKGQSIEMDKMFLRQEEAYKSTLPFGESMVDEHRRNFNTGALTACFPFYNSEISHENGVFIGVNISTMTPIFIDFYDRKILPNHNASVFGRSGSGKTFFVSLLTLRSALKQIRTVIIDPEGEYKKLTEAMGGAYIKISPESKSGINPLDVEEEYDPETKEWTVLLNEKIADAQNLIAVMNKSITMEQRAIVTDVLSKLYTEDFGITTDPKSLYEEDRYDEKGNLVKGAKKRMPTLSDFHAKLLQHNKENPNPDMDKLARTLTMFLKDGIYGLFDRNTSKELEEFKDAPIVTFDMSDLEEGTLRPIGMFVALSWTWEKFVKKNHHIKKRVVCDEAWLLVSPGMEGSEYTATFLENAARRIRKRNGGLLVASQNFAEFTYSPQGRAVLTNTVVKILLKQNDNDIDAVGDEFKLSEGEKRFLMTANTGQMLIKMENESAEAQAIPFEYEKQLIENAYVVKD